MNEHTAFYQQQRVEDLKLPQWLAARKSQAMNQLEQQSFPTRQDEDWKYTPVHGLLSQSFIPVSHAVSAYDWSIPASDKPYVCQKGVLVLPVAEAAIQQAELLESILGSALQPTHAFHALNDALLSGGYLVYVPANLQVETPLCLAHHLQQGQSAYTRHLVVLESGAQLTLVEDFTSQGTTYTNSITEITLAEDAKLTHYKVQRESSETFHTGHTAVRQTANSYYAHHSIQTGGQLLRSDLVIRLEASGADCLMNAIYTPGTGQHVDHHTLVEHLVPACHSKQDYKGVISGQGHAVFNGRVVVAKDAQKTVAEQQNKNLLLDRMAEVDTKPQLEIFADDVICSHGATVGQLDEDALFYLATRGIDQKTAKQYLTHAFAEANLDLIPHPILRDWIREQLSQHLESRL